MKIPEMAWITQTNCKKKKKLGYLKILSQPAKADFWVFSTYFLGNFSTFCCINLKQEVEKTQKSAEAGCLKILSWFNFFLQCIYCRSRVFNVFVLSFKTFISSVYSVTGIAMPLSILGITWSFISSIYSMCVCVYICVYIYIYIKQVSVQAPFRHRHRFKSIDLAPVSKKNQTIPNPNYIRIFNSINFEVSIIYLSIHPSIGSLTLI